MRLFGRSIYLLWPSDAGGISLKLVAMLVDGSKYYFGLFYIICYKLGMGSEHKQ